MSERAVLPLSGIVAWWGTAWLRGLVGPDEVTDALSGTYVAHVARRLSRPTESMPLLQSLAGIRTPGAALAAVFPEPGDPTGLGGSSELVTAAIEAGEAVVTVGVDGGLGWVPQPVGSAVEWTAHRVDRRPPPDLGEADRLMRSVLLTATEELVRLDVARWRPEVADALLDLRSSAPILAPPGVPARAVELAGRALHLRAVHDLALADDGAAVSAAEAAARREAVLPLGRAARGALAAACSPDGWPPT